MRVLLAGMALAIAVYAVAELTSGDDGGRSTSRQQLAGSIPFRCTHVWIASGSGGNWDDPAKWSPHEVPGRRDVACLPRGSSAVIAQGDHELAGLVAGGSLTMVGGGLALMEPGFASELGDLNFTDAVVSGPGPLYITRSLWWGPRATLSGAGVTTLTALGVGILDGCPKRLPAIVAHTLQAYPARVARESPANDPSSMMRTDPCDRSAPRPRGVRVDRSPVPGTGVARQPAARAIRLRIPCWPQTPPYMKQCARPEPASVAAVQQTYRRFKRLAESAGTGSLGARAQMQAMLAPTACVGDDGSASPPRRVAAACRRTVDRLLEGFGAEQWSAGLQSLLVMEHRAAGTVGKAAGSRRLRIWQIRGQWRITQV